MQRSFAPLPSTFDSINPLPIFAEVLCVQPYNDFQHVCRQENQKNKLNVNVTYSFIFSGFSAELIHSRSSFQRISVSMTLPKGTAEREIVERISGWLPHFQDVFDEETFYIFVITLVVLSVIGAVLASRFITIKDAGHIEQNQRTSKIRQSSEGKPGSQSMAIGSNVHSKHVLLMSFLQRFKLMWLACAHGL